MISAEVRASIAASIGRQLLGSHRRKKLQCEPTPEHGGKLCNRLGLGHAIKSGHQ